MRDHSKRVYERATAILRRGGLKPPDELVVLTIQGEASADDATDQQEADIWETQAMAELDRIEGKPQPSPLRRLTDMEKHDARMKAEHMIKGLSQGAKRVILDQVIDRYYYNREGEAEAEIAKTGAELDETLVRALMNYWMPGSV